MLTYREMRADMELVCPLELLPQAGSNSSSPYCFKEKRGMSGGEEDESFCINSWRCGSQGGEG